AMERRQAAGDDQLLSISLAGGEADDRVDRLLLRGVDEAAGVDDNDVGGLGSRDRDVLAGAQHTADPLAVGDVLRAAQGDDVVAHPAMVSEAGRRAARLAAATR